MFSFKPKPKAPLLNGDMPEGQSIPSSEIDKHEKIYHRKIKEVSSWTVFEIMSEFVRGFDFLKRYKKAVSFFGTSRAGFGHEVYDEATNLAAKLSKAGFAIISGGGPGIMEAANKGAFEAGGHSVGINIRLPNEQRTNQYVTESESFSFFFTRKVMLEFASQVYIFFPGGFGTLDEFFEMVTLIQTKKIKPIPIILVGRNFWGPLLSWITATMYEQNHAIDEADMEIYHLVDNADEAYAYIKQIAKNKHLFN
jgi:uncharacterized protein (TIGR00730 family)